MRHLLQTPRALVKALLTMTLAQTDAESRNNLLFFLQHGVRPDDGAHYIVTVQAENATLVSHSQPLFRPAHCARLPPMGIRARTQASALGSEVYQNNVRFLSHANVCYDW